MENNRLDPFDINCMRMEYNRQYDYLVQMVKDGQITTQEFDSRLTAMKVQYSTLFNHEEVETTDLDDETDITAESKDIQDYLKSNNLRDCAVDGLMGNLYEE